MYLRKICFYLFFIIAFVSCKSNNPSTHFQFSCDAESVSGNDFIGSDGEIFNGGALQTQKYSHSGKSSVEINKKHQYGFGFSFAPIELGDEINIEVWRLISDENLGTLVVTNGKGTNFYLNKSVKTEGKWELIKKDILISTELNGDNFKFFVYNPNTKSAYFDDIKITITKNSGYHIVNHPKLDLISLKIKPSALQQIEMKRQEALKMGVLLSNDDDWVKAKIKWGSDKEIGKIRLKGDWTDHLMGEKRSYRINISKGKKLNGFTKFSIQNPISRHYLEEWFAHRVLTNQNVLTTEYSFINLKINNEVKGIYSFEEHFTDILLNSQERENGVILKFNENPMWVYRSTRSNRKKPGPDWFHSAEIVAFGMGSIMNNQKKKKEFLEGRDLLYQFQFKNTSPESLFDIGKMARFLALTDIFKSYHGLIWHNMRFYYNSKTKLLEPIAYDLYTEKGVYDSSYVANVLIFQVLNYLNGGSFNYYNSLFTNQSFLEKYTYYLNLYSTPGFIDEQLNENQKDLVFFEKEIQNEYHFYRFNRSFYIENSIRIQKEMPKIKEAAKQLSTSQNKIHRTFRSVKNKYQPINNTSLKAYHSINNNKAELEFVNLYNRPIIVTGYIIETDTIALEKTIRVIPFTNFDDPNRIEIEVNALFDKAIYQVEGEATYYYQDIVPLRAPQLNRSNSRF